MRGAPTRGEGASLVRYDVAIEDETLVVSERKGAYKVPKEFVAIYIRDKMAQKKRGHHLSVEAKTYEVTPFDELEADLYPERVPAIRKRIFERSFLDDIQEVRFRFAERGEESKE